MQLCRVKYWQIIADNLSKAGWSWGYVSTINSNGQTIFVADAHCDDGKRFVVRADEKLAAFAELESATRPCGRTPRNCGAHEIKLDNCRDDGKSLLDFVIRQFQLIFGTAE
jgi:hypothetical protein